MSALAKWRNFAMSNVIEIAGSLIRRSIITVLATDVQIQAGFVGEHRRHVGPIQGRR